jgi:hypothetical protein
MRATTARRSPFLAEFDFTAPIRLGVEEVRGLSWFCAFYLCFLAVRAAGSFGQAVNRLHLGAEQSYAGKP